MGRVVFVSGVTRDEPLTVRVLGRRVQCRTHTRKEEEEERVMVESWLLLLGGERGPLGSRPCVRKSRHRR